MSFFTKIFGNDVSGPVSRDPSDNFWFQPLGSSSGAGVRVNTKNARTVPVVRDCLQVLSGSVSGLSFGVFEKVSDTEVAPRNDHPLMALFNNPNPETTSIEFFADLMEDLATDGDFYAEIIYDARGMPIELWRFDPDDVTPERLPNRDRRYRVREAGLPERVLLSEELWHIRVPPTIGGLVGTSAIKEGAEAIGAALAVQQYSSAFFKNDATPSMLIKHPGQFKDPASRQNWLNAFKKWSTGNNRHSPAVLEFGMEAQQMSVTPEQAQFIETRRELALEITRIWHIPPHKVGILDRATFSNIEQQSLEFVTDTLTPWLELIERSVQKYLMLVPDRFEFQFNVASLLRGDLKSRYDAYAVGRQWGFISVNEIRRFEKMNGIGVTGDRYIEPLNMAPAGTATPNNQQQAISFLRESVAKNGRRPKLEIVKDVA